MTAAIEEGISAQKQRVYASYARGEISLRQAHEGVSAVRSKEEMRRQFGTLATLIIFSIVVAILAPGARRD